MIIFSNDFFSVNQKQNKAWCIKRLPNLFIENVQLSFKKVKKQR